MVFPAAFDDDMLRGSVNILAGELVLLPFDPEPQLEMHYA